MGVPKFPKLGLSWLWGPITLSEDLWLRWGLKQSFSSCWELSNGMWHVTCTQEIQGDSWLLVVGSQIVNLTPSLSFGCNLCFKYSNGSCEPILDVYIPITFQWYKEFFDPMVLTFVIALWKFRSSAEIQLSKWELTWECAGSFPHSLLHSQEHEMWLPCLSLGPHLCKPLPWSQTQD